MSIPWLKKIHNNQRTPGRFGDIPRVANTIEKNDTWHSWDLEVDPGVYVLKFVSGECNYCNYFTMGTVDLPNQVNPIHPDRRSGEIVFKKDDNTFRCFNITKPLTCKVEAGQILRIESWVFHTGRRNEAPLPEGFGYWRSYKYKTWRTGDWTYDVHFETSRYSNFEGDFQSVNKITTTPDSLYFASEDGPDDDFNDLCVQLQSMQDILKDAIDAIENTPHLDEIISGLRNKSKNIFIKTPSTGYKPDKPNEFPNWVRRNHTEELLLSLKGASYAELPGKIDVEKSKKLLTMIYEAGLEFQSYLTYYKGYVPVYVFCPVKRRQNTPSLPDRCRSELTEQERIQSQILRDRFSGISDWDVTTRAYSQNARTTNWDLAQIVAGRVEMYQGIIEAGEDISKLSKSLSIGFVSTGFGIAEMYAEASGIDDPVIRAAISCPAFMVGLATTIGASPAVSIAVIGLISGLSLLESGVSCVENLNHIFHFIKPTMEEQFKFRLLSRTITQGHKAVEYNIINDRLVIRRSDGSTETHQMNEINENHIVLNSDGRPPRDASFYERDSPYGGKLKCWDIKETGIDEHGRRYERHWEGCLPSDSSGIESTTENIYIIP